MTARQRTPINNIGRKISQFEKNNNRHQKFKNNSTSDKVVNDNNNNEGLEQLGVSNKPNIQNEANYTKSDNVINNNNKPEIKVMDEVKTDRMNNLQLSRISHRSKKNILKKSKIPRAKRPVTTANKISHYYSLTRVPIKKSSKKSIKPSTATNTDTEQTDESEKLITEKRGSGDDIEIKKTPEFDIPLEKKISSSICNDSYFDDDYDDTHSNSTDESDNNIDDNDDEDDDENLHCSCSSCVEKFKLKKEYIQQWKNGHWSTSDILKSARYLDSSSSSLDTRESSTTDSSPVIQKKVYRRYAKEIYSTPTNVKSDNAPKAHSQVKQSGRYKNSFFHIILDIIFWPIVLFRKAK